MGAFKGLMWEQWRQSRLVVVAGHTMILMLATGAWVLDSPGFQVGEPAVVFSYWIAVIALGLTLPNHLLRGMTMAVPQRMSVMPVKKGQILLCMFLYRIFIALSLSALIFVVEGLFEYVYWTGMFPFFLLFFALWGCLFSLISTRYSHTIAAFVTMCVPLLCLLIASAVYDARVGNITALVVLVGLLPLGYLLNQFLAGRAVQCMNQGAEKPARDARALPIAAKAEGADAGFPLALRLARFELHQGLWLLPVSVLVLGPLLALYLGEYMVQSLAILPPGIAFGVGYLMYKQTEQYPSQFLLRPYTTRQLAHGRLLAGAIATIVACGGMVLVISTAQGYLYQLGYDEIIFMFTGTWLSLYCGRMLLVLSPLPYALGILLVVLARHDDWSVIVALVTLALLILALLGRGLRRGLLGRFPVIAIMVCVLLSVVAYNSYASESSGNDLALTYFFGLLFLFLPLAWVPVAIDRQRHR